MVEPAVALHERHQGPEPQNSHPEAQGAPKAKSADPRGIWEFTNTFRPLLKYFLTITEKRTKRQFYRLQKKWFKMDKTELWEKGRYQF